MIPDDEPTYLGETAGLRAGSGCCVSVGGRSPASDRGPDGDVPMSFLIGLILGLSLALPLLLVAVALVAMIWGDDA